MSVFKVNSNLLAYFYYYNVPEWYDCSFFFFPTDEEIEAQKSMPKDMWLLFQPGMSRLCCSNKNSKTSECDVGLFSCSCCLLSVLGDSAHASFQHTMFSPTSEPFRRLFPLPGVLFLLLYLVLKEAGYSILVISYILCQNVTRSPWHSLIFSMGKWKSCLLRILSTILDLEEMLPRYFPVIFLSHIIWAKNSTYHYAFHINVSI